ncbi:hypothetical protein ACS0TY_034605 [Phlomoides rotata]
MHDFVAHTHTMCVCIYICTTGSSRSNQTNNMNQIIQNQEIFQNGGHILVVACPLQGHTAALVKLSHQITKFGAKVTFLAMDSTHERTSVFESWDEGIRVISIPSGIRLEGGRKDEGKLFERAHIVIPDYLEDILKRSDDRISGVIFDAPLAWMLGIPQKVELKTAVYWCSCAGCLAIGFKIPQLIESKFIDNDGTPLKNESVELLPNMPDMMKTDLMWHFPSDKNMQKVMFDVIKSTSYQMKNADWILGSWFHELDRSAITLSPNILSIGPLLAHGQSSGSFCSEDDTCLNWLDKQPYSSVVYVAFGSTSRFDQQQLDELAMGLELMGRPFLWVAWLGLTNGLSPTYSDEFKKRVGDRGKIVEWAPQEVVLGHPSVACFITHCGWNSCMESLSMGVPMLCWPYFGDQMYAVRCVCDVWKVGIRLKDEEGGIVWRDGIKEKVEELMCDGIVIENVFKWKRIARESISEGGSSFTNLQYLIQQMKS